MTVTTSEPGAGSAAGGSDSGEKSDWKVVLQFFIVPLALVAVLVSVFFGLQVLRSRHPDPGTTLDDLKSTAGFVLPWVGDPKRWQSGYDLSLLLRSGEGGPAAPLLPKMADAFRDARRADDLKLRRYLALALGRTGEARAAIPLSEGLADADGETRLYCAWGLMQVGGPPVLPVLRQAIASHADAGVRKMAVFALGQLGDRAGAPVLRAALGDEDMDVRWNAAIALARIGDASGEPVLIEILETWSPGGTRAGATARAEDASPALNAIRGLALLKDVRARAALERAAHTAKSEEVRRTARLALESLGAGPRGALP
jgi:HEAT repeat protein